MNTSDYENFVLTTDVKAGEHDLEFYLDGIKEENGEIFGVTKRIRRGDYGEKVRKLAKEKGILYILQNYKRPKKDFLKEIGDERWYATRALQEVLGFIHVWKYVDYVNNKKLKGRKKRKKIVGHGDNR